MNPGVDLPLEYTGVLKFITRMAGYPSHYISRGQVYLALDKAEFKEKRIGPTGSHDCGLIVTAQWV